MKKEKEVLLKKHHYKYNDKNKKWEKFNQMKEVVSSINDDILDVFTAKQLNNWINTTKKDY